jgi:hypothetical protein
MNPLPLSGGGQWQGVKAFTNLLLTPFYYERKKNMFK